MSTDTISDMLTCIRNAILAKHKVVKIPYTKITFNITNLLLKEGLIKSYRKLKIGRRYSMLLSLKYTGKKGQIPFITNLKRISKPGSRVYYSSKKIPRVREGFGIAIISTSKGILTDKQARERGVGGEVLCYIW